MSIVKIQGHASGTGTLTVTAPNTSTNRTLTLPDTTGTLLDENSSLPAANVTGTLPAISGASLTSVNAVNSGRRNMIINGAMKVAQRATSTAWASNGYIALDRYSFANNNTAGRFTAIQTADGPSGFANCLEIDVTTADTSIAADEHLVLQYKLEGQDLQQIAKGTADAKQVTVSFYVKGNASATYMCELFDRDNTRKNQQQFSVTTGWTRVELTFAADTTGAFDDDNAHSLDVQFWLHAGADFTGGSYTANTWADTASANRAVGISSLYSSTSNYFRITGLQLELGAVATDFEHRSYGEELLLCERYYQTYVAGEQEWIYCEGTATTHKWWQVRYRGMRAAPTFSASSAYTGVSSGNVGGGDIVSLSGTPSLNRVSVRVTMTNTSGTAHGIHHIDAWANDSCYFDAEL